MNTRFARKILCQLLHKETATVITDRTVPSGIIVPIRREWMYTNREKRARSEHAHHLLEQALKQIQRQEEGVTQR